MSRPPPVRLVSAQYIRNKFNDGQFWQRAQNGQLATVLKRNGHPSPARAKLPLCTRSQLVVYLDGKKVVAMVHQYVLPDGTLGGSGRPDPKLLRLDQVTLQVRP